MMARTIRTSHVKNRTIPGMAYPLMVLVLATTASYPPMPDLIDRLTEACCPGGPAAGDGPADGDAATGVPGLGRREQPAVPGLAVARDDPSGIEELRTGEAPGGQGRALPRSYRWCCCAGSSAGPLGAVLTPACRCTPDPVPPRPAIHGQRGPAFLKCRARVGTGPGLCATALAGAHIPIASWRIVRHPRAARVRPGGAPRTGNADDAQAGPGWRRSPGELSTAPRSTVPK